jgi:hypothetical protein
VGRTSIQPGLVVDCVGDADLAHGGGRLLKLGLPADTVGFEFVSVGRRVRLKADHLYEATVWARWPDGPELSPEVESVPAKRRSAIVSFWVRHQNARGDFAGRDVWLLDRTWRRLSFRFRGLDSTQPSLLYVSLLPNQAPGATTILVDDFTLTEIPVASTAAGSTEEGVREGGFQSLSPGEVIGGVWTFANMGGSSIAGEVVKEGDERFVRITMKPGTSNFESAQLAQRVELEAGVRYRVGCRMRLESAEEAAAPAIVNFGLYHERSNTWYGPIDVILKRTGGWVSYRFDHIPPFEGGWRLYVQLNGWGNFGNPLTVCFDDFSCRPLTRGEQAEPGDRNP